MFNEKGCLMKKLFTLLSLSALVLLTTNLPLAAKGKGNNLSKRQMRNELTKSGKSTTKAPQKKKRRRQQINQERQPTVTRTSVDGHERVHRIFYGMQYQ